MPKTLVYLKIYFLLANTIAEIPTDMPTPGNAMIASRWENLIIQPGLIKRQCIFYPRETGVPNRKNLMRHAHQEISKYKETDSKVSPGRIIMEAMNN